MFQECIKNKLKKVKFDNKNTSDVNLALSIWKNDINEAALDVIEKSRKVHFFFFKFLRQRNTFYTRTNVL
jgi:hypothetical protein